MAVRMPVIVFAMAVVVIAAAVVFGVVGVIVVVMLVVVVVVLGVLLLGHHLVALKQTHAQQQRQAHLPLHRAEDAGVGLDVAQARLHRRQPLLANQIALVEHQDVAVHHLGPGHIALEDLLGEVLGIDQGDDRIQPGRIAQVAAQKRHRHWQWIRQTGGFHHQIIHGIGAIEDAIHRLEQFAVDRAADAAVAQLHHVFAGGDDQVVVDADLAELIHQHGGFHALLIAEDVVEQGGLAGPEEAGEDRHRQCWGGGVHHAGRGGVGHAGDHAATGSSSAVSLIAGVTVRVWAGALC